MRGTFLIIILLSSLIGIAMTSSPKRKDLIGVWGIKTVLVDEDTLFHADNWRTTGRFYKKNMKVKAEDETDAYNDYVENCVKSTIGNLSQVRLEIKKRRYSQTAIMPCWDNIKHPEVEKSKYQVQNDTLKLIETDMNLHFERETNTLVYKNRKYNYEITFSKTD